MMYSDRDDGDAWKVSPSAYASTRPPQFEVSVVPASCYVTMQDGCRLAVDYYLPRASAASGQPPERFPTIVMFTPYNRRFEVVDDAAERSPNAAKFRDFFVVRGYALVVVDVRGTGASFGTRDAFRSPKERGDYREIVDWIVSMPWSDGIVGSTGISYSGAAACFVASTGHPAVKAIAPLFGISDSYTDQLYPGGMLSRIWVEGYDAMMVALDQDHREQLARYAYFGDPRLDGAARVDEDHDGSLLAAAVVAHKANFRFRDLAHELAFREEPAYHDPTLDTGTCSPYRYMSGMQRDVAVLSVGGWFDAGNYSNGSISRYLTLADNPRHLLLGPWDHGARTHVSPWRSQAASQFPLHAGILRFFDHYLMKLDTGLDEEAPIHYFSIHAEAWKAADAWPPISQATRYYPDAGLGLSRQPSPDAQQASYQVSFATGTGKRSRFERLAAVAVEDYYPDWQQRQPSMLNFTSEPLAEAMEVSGHIVAQLNLASSETDAALFVYVSEVDHEGHAHYVTEGVLRALHRKQAACPSEYRTTWPFRTFHRSDTELLTPGVPERLVFALLPVSWTFQPGSRLRISVCGADADHFGQVPHGRPPRLDFVLGGSEATFFEIPCRPVGSRL